MMTARLWLCDVCMEFGAAVSGLVIRMVWDYPWYGFLDVWLLVRLLQA